MNVEVEIYMQGGTKQELEKIAALLNEMNNPGKVRFLACIGEKQHDGMGFIGKLSREFDGLDEVASYTKV